jgi:hypothetical protein
VPHDEEDDFWLSQRTERWSVESVVAALMPLLKHKLVTAYAVHPVGRTIFVSAQNRSRLNGEMKEGTHSFDTRSAVWTWHGEWQLPFLGQGRYVDELDAWVRIHRDGFLCSCAVASRGGAVAAGVEDREGDDIPRGPGAARRAAYTCHAHVHGRRQVLPR